MPEDSYCVCVNPKERCICETKSEVESHGLNADSYRDPSYFTPSMLDELRPIHRQRIWDAFSSEIVDSWIEAHDEDEIAERLEPYYIQWRENKAKIRATRQNGVD